MMKKIKELFATPKKAVITSVCVLGGLAVLGTGTSFATAAVAKNQSIGIEGAQTAVLADAGVAKDEAFFTKTEFDFDDGRFVYDVTFLANGTEYDYKVKASDGTIMRRETEPTRAIAATEADTGIGVEAAKQKALADAGLTTSQVTFAKEALDRENGGVVYDVEFYTDSQKYEYEINAETGAVVNKSVEARTQTNQQSATTNVTSQTDIGLEAAKQKALADASVSASQVTFTKGRKDWDDGSAIYDVEFYTSSQKYEYEINAATGAVVSKDVEARKQTATAQTSQTSGSQQSASANAGTSATSQTDIGLEAAKQKALADAGVSASQVTFTKGRKDWDDGILLYEVEFYTDSASYEYDIKASNGAVYQRSVEKFRQQQNQNGSGSYIGVDKAKSIAIQHAGVSADQVQFSKAKLENDDGLTVYEVEFFANGMEYEYQIQALTGDIIDFDADYTD